jgi:hypothetical protein
MYSLNIRLFGFKGRKLLKRRNWCNFAGLNMMLRYRYRTRNRPIFWLDRLLRSCFIAIVTLFLVWEGGNASASVSSKRDTAAYFFDDHSSEHRDSPEPAPLERDVRDEGESESDSEDEADQLNHTVTSEITRDFHSGKLLFFQLRLACESRASVSLIILHHCWKSFLR